MQGDWLARRVTLLEQRMERLETLSSEVAVLRADLNTHITVVREDMDGLRSDMHSRFAVRADVDARFVRLRDDMDAGISAVRTDVDSLREVKTRFALQGEMDTQISALRTDMHTLRADINARFATQEDTETAFDAVHQGLISLQTQIVDHHRQMLVLHEELVSRIKTLGELWDQRPRRPRKKR